MSSPSVKAHRPAAVAMPEPEDDPPGSASGFHGLRGWPNGNSRVPPSANSVRFSLPRSSAPAARSRATTVASVAGTTPLSTREPIVVESAANASSPAEAAQALVRAAAAGELAPDVAAELIAALRGCSDIRQADEIERRLAELEGNADAS